MADTLDFNVRVYPYFEIAGGDTGESPLLEDFVILGKPCPAVHSGIVGHLGAGACIRSHTVIYAGTHIADNFQTGHHVTIRELTRIGRNVSIGTGSVIEHHVEIGDEVRLHANVFVPEYSTLHAGCWLGPNVVLTNAKYPRSPRAKAELVGPTILPRAKIGANVTILPGITIGEDALIGAGSVIVRDVPDRGVVVGNPGHVIKMLDDLPY